MTKKKSPVFLVAFVEGGNLTGLYTNTKRKLIQNVTDLKPVHREESKGYLTAAEIEECISEVEKKPGNCHRFEDEDGEDDISVINITGKKFRAGMEIW